MKNQDGDTGCTADVLGQVRMTRMYEGGGCVWFTNDILIRTHPGAYINTKVHTYIQLVVATVQEKLFKRKYRFKSVNLACQHRNRSKREFVLFWNFSLKSNI